MSLNKIFPSEINGWSQAGALEKYDHETIFKYMNGAGEIYRMYDYRKMEVLRLAKPDQPEIKIELFDMGSPDDAFGVFSHMREGEEAGVGEGSEYRKGLLCFWQGRYLFCIITEQETEETKQALFDLAGKITAYYRRSDIKPALVNVLPNEKIHINTIRYFNLQSSLNYHYFVSEENILALNKDTEAVMARYGETYCYLLCIKYPKETDAKKAYDQFQAVYLPEANDLNIYQLEENKWLMSNLLRNYIVLIFDAPTEKFAQSLNDKALNNIILK